MLVGLLRFAILHITVGDKCIPGPYLRVKSVQSTLSHLITTSVPRAMFTHFVVEQGLSQFCLY